MHVITRKRIQEFTAKHPNSESSLENLDSQEVISEILNRKRELNLRQVKALSDRFKVPVSVFI